MKNNKKPKVKRKIRFDRILICLFLLCIIIWGSVFLLNIKITNIYISNNQFLTDQYIIDKAGLSNYPSTLKNLSFSIENKLESDIFILDAKVSKKLFNKVYIEVEENLPLFYYEYTGQTTLSNGYTVDKKYSVPIVVNYIKEPYYEEFIKQISKLDREVLEMISEIEFCPNNSDDNRFLLTMRDGNYVYVNLISYDNSDGSAFDKLNRYISIKAGLPKKKGVLYLDDGNNFKFLE